MEDEGERPGQPGRAQVAAMMLVLATVMAIACVLTLPLTGLLILVASSMHSTMVPDAPRCTPAQYAAAMKSVHLVRTQCASDDKACMLSTAFDFYALYASDELSFNHLDEFIVSSPDLRAAGLTRDTLKATEALRCVADHLHLGLFDGVQVFNLGLAVLGVKLRPVHPSGIVAQFDLANFEQALEEDDAARRPSLLLRLMDGSLMFILSCMVVHTFCAPNKRRDGAGEEDDECPAPSAPEEGEVPANGNEAV